MNRGDVASLPAPINTQQNEPTCKAHGTRARHEERFHPSQHKPPLTYTAPQLEVQRISRPQIIH